MIKAVRIATLLAAFVLVVAIAFVTDPESDLEAAGAALANRDYDQALWLARRGALLGQDEPRREAAMKIMAKAALELGNPQYAEGCLREAVALNPKSAASYLLLATIAADSGELNQALTDYDLGLGLLSEKSRQAPGMARHFAGCGLVYLRLENQAAAIKNATHALKINSRDPDTRYLWSHILAERGQYLEALKQMELAHSLAQARDRYFFLGKKGKSWTQWLVRLRMKNGVDPTKPYQG